MQADGIIQFRYLLGPSRGRPIAFLAGAGVAAVGGSLALSTAVQPAQGSAPLPRGRLESTAVLAIGPATSLPSARPAPPATAVPPSPVALRPVSARASAPLRAVPPSRSPALESPAESKGAPPLEPVVAALAEPAAGSAEGEEMAGATVPAAVDAAPAPALTHQPSSAPVADASADPIDLPQLADADEFSGPEPAAAGPVASPIVLTSLAAEVERAADRHLLSEADLPPIGEIDPETAASVVPVAYSIVPSAPDDTAAAPIEQAESDPLPPSVEEGATPAAMVAAPPTAVQVAAPRSMPGPAARPGDPPAPGAGQGLVRALPAALPATDSIGAVRPSARGVEFAVATLVNGAQAGRLPLLIVKTDGRRDRPSSEIYVRVADLLGLFSARMSPQLFADLSTARAAQAFVTLNELRAHGIAVSFDDHDRLVFKAG
jgi:hypothetical protein